MSDWKKMVKFSNELIKHARAHSDIGVSRRSFVPIAEQRMAVVLLDQATELLMKAYLMKNGYCIETVSMTKIKNGIKKSDKINKFLNDKKTIDFPDALSIIKKLLPIVDNEKITEFHELRNEIYHRSLKIHVDKKNEIERFIPILKSLYNLAFPGRHFPNEDDVMDLIRKYYR